METQLKNDTSSSIGAFDFFDPAGPDINDTEETRKHTRRRMLEGELGLLLAVLEDGVNCYLKNLSAKDRLGRKTFDEAEEWIFEDGDSDWLFSFKNVCELLGIVPAYVRQGLLERKKKAEARTGGSTEYRLEKKTA